MAQIGGNVRYAHRPRAFYFASIGSFDSGMAHEKGNVPLHANGPGPRTPIDTRRILASRSGGRGCASGSDRAAAMTSSSVRASSRPQSVSPRGRGSPGFTVTRVDLLMSCGLPGGYDSADVLATQFAARAISAIFGS